jgi:hypothetical protein
MVQVRLIGQASATLHEGITTLNTAVERFEPGMGQSMHRSNGDTRPSQGVL